MNSKKFSFGSLLLSWLKQDLIIIHMYNSKLQTHKHNIYLHCIYNKQINITTICFTIKQKPAVSQLIYKSFDIQIILEPFDAQIIHIIWHPKKYKSFGWELLYKPILLLIKYNSTWYSFNVYLLIHSSVWSKWFVFYLCI